MVKDDGTMQDVVVEIERVLRKKPFLGGYRHKKTGVEYHHASAQTMAKQKPQSNTEKYCRYALTLLQSTVLFKVNVLCMFKRI